MKLSNHFGVRIIASLVLLAILLISPLNVTAHDSGSLPKSSTILAPKGQEANCQNFTDVSTNYYACDAVKALVTQGAISGYNDYATCGPGIPCFKPTNLVTRGQFSKMAAIYKGLTCASPCNQYFTDVPVTNPFFSQIMALYYAGDISGYAGTDCTNVGVVSPCFLWQNNVLRGQAAKIVTNSNNYVDIPQIGRQTYADVSSSNQYYTQIERLVMYIAAPPYPHDLTLPTTCTPTTTPCFYPFKDMVRADAAMMIFNGYQGIEQWRYGVAYEQVFPKKYGAFDFASASVQTPGPPSTNPYSGFKYGSPIALTDLMSTHVEAGYSYQCDSSGCHNWAYSSYNTGYPTYMVSEFDDSMHPLSVGTTYNYSISKNTGVHSWSSTYCTGSTCRSLLTTPNLGVDVFPYVLAGGESTQQSYRWGSLTISNNITGQGSSHVSWCYNPADLYPWVTYDPLPQDISSCNTSTHTWTVTH